MHEFFPQPHGNPPFCFCREEGCSGWDDYLAWFRDSTGSEPDDEAITAHERIAAALKDLTSRYRDLLTSPMDFNTALDLADVEKSMRQVTQDP